MHNQMVAIVRSVFLEVCPALKHAMAESILFLYLFEYNTSGSVAGGVPSCHRFIF